MRKIKLRRTLFGNAMQWSSYQVVCFNSIINLAVIIFTSDMHKQLNDFKDTKACAASYALSFTLIATITTTTAIGMQ